MKKILSILLFSSIFCAFGFSAIIVQKNGVTIEGVENITITSTKVTYIINGQEQSISKEDVEAYMDDNGNYEEVRHTQSDFQETYSPIVEEPYNEIRENPAVDNTIQYQREKKQKKTRNKTEPKETIQAWGNWVKSAFKGDKDGWNPIKNPLWNKESRAKYSNVNNTTEQQSPAPSYPDTQVQPNDNNW